ncbi:MAG: hypothetical protein ACD_28C00069G0003 [uncultured bacterium]|nr:MAG: hypothetical protein ACD_28C00069G0003 [uncultured bacterium]KKT74091.1 MAG: hypothetical protein UW70_C0067G0008 [Candidatus Peregrinibacteria bacterium GW2011_GWA2_44_7]
MAGETQDPPGKMEREEVHADTIEVAVLVLDGGVSNKVTKDRSNLTP